MNSETNSPCLDPGIAHINKVFGWHQQDTRNIYEDQSDLGVLHIRRALGMIADDTETDPGLMHVHRALGLVQDRKRETARQRSLGKDNRAAASSRAQEAIHCDSHVVNSRGVRAATSGSHVQVNSRGVRVATSGRFQETIHSDAQTGYAQANSRVYETSQTRFPSSVSADRVSCGIASDSSGSDDVLPSYSTAGPDDNSGSDDMLPSYADAVSMLIAEEEELLAERPRPPSYDDAIREHRASSNT